MNNLAAIETNESETLSHYTVEPIKELSKVLWDYIFDGSHGLNLTPAQDQVINALLSQIQALCNESLSGQ
jgi:hypothetical protein|tara:strand:- start:264 stop:473 length:210 start_codon:yes stop_codon:yes gene_type:complete